MKPVILGLNNPHSSDPKKALGTEPVGSAGHRLWLMVKCAANRAGLDFEENDYLGTFDRRNLSNEKFFDYQEAKRQRPEVLASIRSRTVVMCGTGVLRALGLSHTGFHLDMQQGVGFTYYTIPHPSGLTRDYNDPLVRARVGDLMLRLYRKHHGL